MWAEKWNQRGNSFQASSSDPKITTQFTMKIKEILRIYKIYTCSTVMQFLEGRDTNEA